MAKQFLTLKIVETPRQIQSKIKEALVRRLGHPVVLKVASSLATKDIRDIFRKLMKESHTYQDLVSSSSVLRGEMGLTNPALKLSRLIDVWGQSIKVTFRKVGRASLGIKGGFTINFVKANWADVLSSPEAQQRDRLSKRNPDAKPLDWLSWLLLRGDEKIIIGYDATFAERHGARSGRTGLAVMYKPKLFRSWSVPPGYAGTKDKNFVTQVLDKMEEPVCRAIEEAIRYAVSRA